MAHYQKHVKVKDAPRVFSSPFRITLIIKLEKYTQLRSNHTSANFFFVKKEAPCRLFSLT
jgi:hypothetical protein